MAFMVHEKHGATNTGEVAAHEARGWKVSTVEEWIAQKNVVEEVKRRGRPPKVEISEPEETQESQE